MSDARLCCSVAPAQVWITYQVPRLSGLPALLDGASRLSCASCACRQLDLDVDVEVCGGAVYRIGGQVGVVPSQWDCCLGTPEEGGLPPAQAPTVSWPSLAASQQLRQLACRRRPVSQATLLAPRPRPLCALPRPPLPEHRCVAALVQPVSRAYIMSGSPQACVRR